MTYRDLWEVWTVLCKELKDTLRDKRTVALILLLPAVYFPLFSLVAIVGAGNFSKAVESKKFRACIFGKSEKVGDYLTRDTHILLKQTPQGDTTPEAAVTNNYCDIAVVLANDFDQAVLEERSANIKLIDLAYASWPTYETRVTACLTKYAEAEQQRRLQHYDLPAFHRKHLVFNSKYVASPADQLIAWLAAGSSLMLSFSVALYCMYPALDLITGERERGTLTCLLVTSADKHNLLLGKMLCISVIAFACSVTSLAAMVLGMVFFARHMPERIGDIDIGNLSGVWTTGLPLLPMLICLFWVFLLSIGIAALSTWISSYARTFQQGQAYFLPVLIVGMFLGGITVLHERSAPLIVYCLPMLNLLLCISKSLLGQLHLTESLLTAGSSACYIAFLVRAAIHIFDNEETLFNIQPTPGKEKSFVKAAIVLAAVAAAAFFYGSLLLQPINFLWGLAAAQLLCIGMPAFIGLKICRLPIRETMRLGLPSLSALLGALLLVPALCGLSSLVVFLQEPAVPETESYLRLFMELLLPKGTNIYVAIVTTAITPAICEELLFRGAIQGMLRKSLPRLPLVIVVGILFGIMHTSLARFLPTASMGIFLALVAECTGSIIPGMLMHACNNALAVLMRDANPQLNAAAWSALGAASLIGVWLLWREEKKVKTPNFKPPTA
jgi:sodium transport system permease protein